MPLSNDTTFPGSFTIEPGRANDLARCDCCGADTRIARGFVYRDGMARAVYLVRWTPGGKHSDADVAVSIGGWCDEDPEPRQLVALLLRQLDGGPAFMVIDAAQTSWSQEDELGQPTKRERVVGTPLGSEAFAILDAIALQDERVLGWRLDAV